MEKLEVPNYNFNSYQTPITPELKASLHKEVYLDLLESLDTIRFIKNLTAHESVRGFAKDRPRYCDLSDGDPEKTYDDHRIIVDLTKPHILEDMDFFRERALFFDENGRYTNIPPNSNPKSEYSRFWKEELKKWKYGVIRESDGEWIPGQLYYYWNYSPIWLVKTVGVTKSGKKKGERVKKFAKPWLGDYLFYHYMEQGRSRGQHGKLLKTRGVGFAQPNATILQQSTGTIRVGDVKVGDMLLDRYGNDTKVLEVYPQGVIDVYEITLADGRTIKCSGDHLWSVYDKNKGSKNKDRLYTYKTSELLEKGLAWKNKNGDNLYKFYIPDLAEPVKYEERDFFIHPYVMGALLGDGALTGTNIRLASNDFEIIERVTKLLDEFSLNKDKSNNNYNCVDLHKRSQGGGKNRLKSEIERLSLNVTTSFKFIPDVYKYSSYEQRLELVKGLMDTDGSISKEGNLEFSNSNEQLVDDLASVLRSMGISCTKGLGRAPHQKEIKGKICNIKQEYRLYIRTNLNLFNISRKSERVKKKKLFLNNPIVSITKLDYKEESTCFLVDNKEHLYLTGDFVPTHNSFKMCSISPCNMYTLPGSGNPNFHLASDSSYLSGDKGIWGKVLDALDWIGETTPLPKMRVVDDTRKMTVQLGFKDEYGTRRGLLSSVFGISLKDNPEKARGIRGPLIHYEEDGLFPNLEKAWNVNLKAVEDGDVAFGYMLAGGCLTANNKVWTNSGRLVSIAELNKSEGIIGFNKDTQTYSKEDITYWQPPTYKECIKITTNTGRFIECSLDHPIMWSNNKLRTLVEQPSVDGKRVRKSFKKMEFREAENINTGDQIAVINELPIFSDIEMWEPRLIGWLIGDGSYGIDKTPILSNCEPEINNYLHSKLDCKVVTESSYLTKDGKKYEENRILGICQKLRDLGIYGQTKSNKTLPLNIHGYSLNTITELLGGFFDADGYVSKTGTISLSCANSNILLEVQLLLQKLGIHGNILFKKPNLNNPKSKNGHYELEIKDKDSVLNFVKYIKLTPYEKQRRLNTFSELLKDVKSQNAKHLNGVRFERVVNIEKIGVQPVYNLTAGTTHTYIGNGVITHNTGGTEGASFEGSEKLFYSPGAYNIYGIPNVYDKDADGTMDCGFFWGAYLNRNECYDETTGEPDVVKALIEIHQARFKVKYNSTDPNAITQKKAEEPITPQEAVMRTEGTVFPVSDLKEHLETINANRDRFLSEHYVGELVRNSQGIVEFRPLSDRHPLRTYDKDTGNREGCLEIFEMPRKNAEGLIPHGRYIAGIDPIDADTGPSLFSIQVMDLFTDRIVAEYTGRPRLAETAYEIALRMLEFYNAQGNYESNLKGLFAYFDRHNKLHYLADVPQIIKDMQVVKATSLYGNNAKGSRANQELNKWGRKLQADWMLTPAGLEGEGNEDKLKLHTLRGLAYIEECIRWNSDGNFDRVSSGIMLFILREDRYKRTQSAKENAITASANLANDKFFKNNYDVKRAMYRNKY